jgi:hypothetical protein
MEPKDMPGVCARCRSPILDGNVMRFATGIDD